MLGGENASGIRGSVYNGSVVSALRSGWEEEVCRQVMYDVFCTMFMVSRFSFSFSGSKGVVDDSVLCNGVARFFFTDL